MKLKELLKSIEVVDCFGSDISNVAVRAISLDSRRVKPGHVFVAVRGVSSDGHQYIPDVLARHAAAVIVSQRPAINYSTSTPFILVDDSKEALMRLCGSFYGYPYRKIKTIGVTGTNGKTTISYLVRSILGRAGKKSGLIGTIAHSIKEGSVVDSVNTTPGIVELHQMMADMIEAGDEYVVMEVSSHALDQERVKGITFNAAIFTNLTQDHLDYHKTMEEYFKAKEKLFTRYSQGDTNCIINQDDPYGVRLLKTISARKISYGFCRGADVHLKSYRAYVESSRAVIQAPAGEIDIKTGLIGRHNLYNILAAAAWGVCAGFDLAVIKEGIESVKSVMGRLERIDSASGFSIFVDYAHTEDALKNVLESLRAILHNGRIITVFGCGGDRDKAKRPKMGHVVSVFSDLVIVTSDNPRSEDPALIADEVARGLDQKKVNIILDRFEAIKEALMTARAGDIVLIAGKGHEAYQIVKDKIFLFNDKLVVESILKEMSGYVQP